MLNNLTTLWSSRVLERELCLKILLYNGGTARAATTAEEELWESLERKYRKAKMLVHEEIHGVRRRHPMIKGEGLPLLAVCEIQRSLSLVGNISGGKYRVEMSSDLEMRSILVGVGGFWDGVCVITGVHWDVRNNKLLLLYKERYWRPNSGQYYDMVGGETCGSSSSQSDSGERSVCIKNEERKNDNKGEARWEVWRYAMILNWERSKPCRHKICTYTMDKSCILWQFWPTGVLIQG
ncbi:hypothetical protein Tco_0328990 [Tanacetum coccineum]